MWYVIQTTTGKENELVRMIEKIVPSELYSDCFITYYERIWRKQQKSIVHVERLFPGYVFIITEQPEALFFHLKEVPAMSKLLASGEHIFLALHQDEEAYMQNLLGYASGHTVRLSYVETDGNGRVLYVSGPLKHYIDRVIRFQFKKRYVIIEIDLLGQRRSIALGLILKEDVQHELIYGKDELLVNASKVYSIPKTAADEAAYNLGDKIKVTSGVFVGVTGSVCNVKSRTIEIEIQMFGQKIEIELPMADVCRIKE